MSDDNPNPDDIGPRYDAGEAIEWVALLTCVSSSDPDVNAMMWEEGGIYPDSNRPRNSAMEAAREFQAGEHVAACPRCGQRFAATPEGTAESHRDLHFDGDEDIPSICRYMPTRRLQLVEKQGGA
jgi:hypothetical protein